MNAIQPEHLCSLGLVGWLFLRKFTVCLRHTKATTLTPTWCIMSNLFFYLIWYLDYLNRFVIGIFFCANSLYSFIFSLHIVDCVAVYSPDGLLSHPLFPADWSSDSELQWDLGRVALPDSALAHTQHAPTAANNRLHQIQPNTFVILGNFCSFVSSFVFFSCLGFSGFPGIRGLWGKLD